jgi:hypothetical protein
MARTKWTAEAIANLQNGKDTLQDMAQAQVKQTPLQRYQALGRLKAGTMNKTEARYAAHLELQKSAGVIAWYAFEVLKLRLADKCFYDTDFLVMQADGALEVHEVKGFFTDDSKVKLKVAADKFPFKFIVVKEMKGKKGWDFQII